MGLHPPHSLKRSIDAVIYFECFKRNEFILMFRVKDVEIIKLANRFSVIIVVGVVTGFIIIILVAFVYIVGVPSLKFSVGVFTIDDEFFVFAYLVGSGFIENR
jgi:hypothetical protein